MNLTTTLIITCRTLQIGGNKSGTTSRPRYSPAAPLYVLLARRYELTSPDSNVTPKIYKIEAIQLYREEGVKFGDSIMSSDVQMCKAKFVHLLKNSKTTYFWNNLETPSQFCRSVASRKKTKAPKIIKTRSTSRSQTRPKKLHTIRPKATTQPTVSPRQILDMQQQIRSTTNVAAAAAQAAERAVAGVTALMSAGYHTPRKTRKNKSKRKKPEPSPSSSSSSSPSPSSVSPRSKRYSKYVRRAVRGAMRHFTNQNFQSGIHNHHNNTSMMIPAPIMTPTPSPMIRYVPGTVPQNVMPQPHIHGQYSYNMYPFM